MGFYNNSKLVYHTGKKSYKLLKFYSVRLGEIKKDKKVTEHGKSDCLKKVSWWSTKKGNELA